MSGTRIMVFQMKRLIKVGICALIGLILIIALVVYLVPGGDAQARDYLPGTYAAQIILHARPVDVTVTVSEKEITDVQLLNMQADQETFYPLFRPTLDELAKQIIKYQTTKIATTPETAVTSKILLQAVDAALRQAKPEEA